MPSPAIATICAPSSSQLVTPENRLRDMTTTTASLSPPAVDDESAVRRQDGNDPVRRVANAPRTPSPETISVSFRPRTPLGLIARETRKKNKKNTQVVRENNTSRAFDFFCKSIGRGDAGVETYKGKLLGETLGRSSGASAPETARTDALAGSRARASPTTATLARSRARSGGTHTHTHMR